jgi:hypothetical protein
MDPAYKSLLSLFLILLLLRFRFLVALHIILDILDLIHIFLPQA